MRAESTNRGRLSALGIVDDDAAAVFADTLVLHVAVDQREERVIAADAHAGARLDLGPALADEDRAGVDQLAAVDLDPEHLRVRVAPVARRAAALLMCQLLALLRRGAASGGLLRSLLDHLGLRGFDLLDGRSLGPAPLLLRSLGLFLFLLVGLETHTADGDDLQRRQVRPSAVVHAHALLRLVADALDPRPARVGDHLGVDVEPVDHRVPHFDLAAVAEEQHAVDLDRRARLRGEAVDQDPISGGDSVLLAAAHDDGRRCRGDKRTIWLGHGERLYQAPGGASPHQD